MNNFRMRMSALVCALGAGLIGCDDAPTDPSDWLSALSVRVQVSRPVFKSGDSTTIRVVYVNKTSRNVVSQLKNATSCIPQFEVRKGNTVVGPGFASITCDAIKYPPTLLRPNEEFAVNYVWRGENHDWAVQLTPGQYTIHGVLQFAPRTLESEGVPIEILR